MPADSRETAQTDSTSMPDTMGHDELSEPKQTIPNSESCDSAVSVSKRTSNRRWIYGIASLSIVLLMLWCGYRLARSQILKACRLAQKEQRWTDLETLSLRWTRWEPQEANAWLMLADAVQHQNRFLEAAEYLGQIPSSSPAAPKALLLESELLFGPANRPMDGELACRKLLALEPRATKAHAHLIRFYAYTLQRDKLTDQLKEAVRVDQEPRDAYIYYFLADSLNMARGEEFNTLWLTSDPDNELFLVAKALQWIGKPGVDARKTADIDEAAVLNEREAGVIKLLERFPHNTNLLADQIDAEIVKGRVNRVVELLGQAPSEAETDNRFWRFKGWVHYTRQEFTAAEAAYRQALQLRPMDWQSMGRLVEVLRSREETTERKQLEELIGRLQDLRSRIRSLESLENCPLDLLRTLGQVARDCGDTFIGEALERRLGPGDGVRQ